MRTLRTILLGLLVMLAALPATAASSDAARTVPARGEGRVLVAPLMGAVDPVMLEFTERVLERAARERFDAVVLQLDTPGGLSTSMDDIVRRIVAAKLPVYVYVSPSGGRAASAGVFITYAADVAAMAPGTNIGSATPVSGGGQELPEDMRKKVVNDAVASITELAAERDRDPEFAEAAIREAENIGAREALERGVVEHVVDDVRSLLRASDGVTVQPKDLTLSLGDAKLVEQPVPWTLRILKRLVDPNLLFLLFGAGVIGLAFELTHPGSILPGVAGGISFLVALFGLSVLPATGTGIALLALATALFAAEAIAPGGGVLGVGGAVALLLGALLLFDDDSGYGVSLPLAIGMALTFGLFFAVLLRKALHTRTFAQTTGGDAMVGMLGTSRTAISPGGIGRVFVDGELWQARASVPIEQGDAVRVTGIDGLQIEIEPAPGATTEGTDP